MSSNDIALMIVSGLEALTIPYMITGSFAANIYGVPRATMDADFVLSIDNREIKKLTNHFEPSFEFDDQLTFETVTGNFKLEAKHQESQFRIEFFLLSDDQHDKERFARRQHAQFGPMHASIPTPEDVVVAKLRWLKHANRSKDREDIRNVLAVSGSALDWDYIHLWTERHATATLLTEIRATIPEL